MFSGMSQSTSSDIYTTGSRLWNEWTRMWNGEPELARVLVADRFALHLPEPFGIDPRSVTTPAAVEAWVRAHRAKFARLRFDTNVGPFVDVRAGVVAGPWFAETSADGSTPPAWGMDTIAFKDAKITEYWTLSKPASKVGDWATRLGDT